MAVFARLTPRILGQVSYIINQNTADYVVATYFKISNNYN